MRDGEPALDETTLERLIEDLGVERAERLLGSFQAEAKRRLERIVAAAREGNLVALHEECHTLKGSAASFGAAAVERQAGEIVVACRSGDTQGALGRVADLQGALAAALAALAARLSGGATETGAAAPASRPRRRPRWRKVGAKSC